MLIPSIDIVDGQAVQLVGGEHLQIEGGDPMAWLEKFARCGEIAVVDIDAARGEGNNARLIEQMCARARIRVGGGIRTVEAAISWLDRGAAKVVIGTAASPDFLARLPRERVIAAVDSRDDAVVAKGWREDTGDLLIDKVGALAPHCGGLLVTFVELEGRLGGTDLERAGAVVTAAGGTRVTVAGGIAEAVEIAELDRIGADAQVGMALYSGRLGLAEALTAPMSSDRSDGLWPTVVVDESGVALGLAYSNLESVSAALETGTGVYQSRTRGIWAKGKTSGATQRLSEIALDCDRDTLRFTVHQDGAGFCHTGSRSCWGQDRGLTALARRLGRLAMTPTSGSNTLKLLADPDLLHAKIIEESAELCAAATPEEVTHEAADLIYFTLVKAVSAGVDLSRIEAELEARALRVTRRPMESSK